ncbi:hypothetical protein HanHA300_Chr07g0248771 [Helianthus annuus]|nr:hypothetical protein HanHA300_Chr07g0248771 [Helianthus annuus]
MFLSITYKLDFFFFFGLVKDTLDLDDDNHSNGHANISVGVNKKLGASVLANNGVLHYLSPKKSEAGKFVAIINGTSSSPSIFASSFSFQSFGTNTNNVSSSSSSTVLSSTTTTTAVSSTFATSVSASAFSFGSATASSTTLSNGGSIFGFSYINRQRISGRLHLLPLHRRSHSSLAQGLARHHHPLQRGLFLVLQLLVLVLLLSPPHLAARPVVPPPCSVLAPEFWT